MRAVRRSLPIAALACLFAVAPAAARVLIPATSTAVSVKIATHPPAASRSTTAKFGWTATGPSLTCRAGSAPPPT